MDQAPRQSGTKIVDRVAIDSHILSKEEYIARLEAELRTFKGDKGKGSSSQVPWRS